MAFINSVDTITALRMLAPNDGDRIYLKAHTIEGDGGHGFFRGVTGTYADDGGHIIVNGTAAWLRETDYATLGHFGYPSTTAGAALVAAITTQKPILVDISAITLTTSDQVNLVLGALSRMTVLTSSLTITLPSGRHAINAATLVRSTNNAKIELVGAAPVETTISSIANVTGQAGAWSVVVNVADSTSIEVGDVVLIDSVTPGVQVPGNYSAPPPIGALQMQFSTSGALSNGATVNEVELPATDYTVKKDPQPDLTIYVGQSDLLISDGQVKRVLSPTASGFTVDAANTPPVKLSGKQYWYTMQPSSAGTVTVSGTTVTGSSTGFTSRVNAGDIIAINGHGVRRIASVDSDTQLTLTQEGMPVSAAATWGVITAGELHEGAWRVTGVTGNQVTWINTSRESYAPPVKLINGGKVRAVKTALMYGTGGIVADGGGAVEIRNIALYGSGGATTVGVDVRGDGGNRVGCVTLGTNTGVCGFGYGAWVGTGGVLYAKSSCWGAASERGVNVTEGGCAHLQGTSITGANGIGVFIGPGSYVHLTSAKINGHNKQGVRQEVGSSTWADFAVIGHNGYNGEDNILVVGGCNCHYVGVRAFCAGGNGLSGQNGGYGRATGFTALCCSGSGLSIYSGQFEANQAILMGNGQHGALASRTNLALEDAGIGYNVGRGIYALTLAEVSCGGSNFFKQGEAVLAGSLSRVYANGTGFEGNTLDCKATDSAFIWIEGHVGATAFSPATLNTAGSDGSIIRDGS